LQLAEKEYNEKLLQAKLEFDEVVLKLHKEYDQAFQSINECQLCFDGAANQVVGSCGHSVCMACRKKLEEDANAKCPWDRALLDFSNKDT
jgi:ferredoxin